MELKLGDTVIADIPQSAADALIFAAQMGPGVLMGMPLFEFSPPKIDLDPSTPNRGTSITVREQNRIYTNISLRFDNVNVFEISAGVR